MCCRDPGCGGGLSELPPQDPAVRTHKHRPHHPEGGLVGLWGDAHQRGHGETERMKEKKHMKRMSEEFSFFFFCYVNCLHSSMERRRHKKKQVVGDKRREKGVKWGGGSDWYSFYSIITSRAQIPPSLNASLLFPALQWIRMSFIQISL